MSAVFVPPPAPIRGAIRLHGVNKRFGTTAPILSQFSLQIQPGQIVSLLGPSGCGKSTVLRLLAGLDRRFDGVITIDGRPVVGPSPTVGVVFQEPRLLPWLTVADNVGFGLAHQSNAQRKTSVRRLLEQVRLDHAATLWPRQLSGGMQQRAAIARALAHEPDILLLDEPFSALDAFTRMHLQDLVLDLWERTRLTTVLVTHDIDEALYLSDRVVVLDAHPARILEDIAIHLPRPRDRGHYELQRQRAALLEHLRFAGRRDSTMPEYEI